jgi:hypothetical protein
MQMAMKIVEMRIMLRGRPSNPMVPWQDRDSREPASASLKRCNLSINVDSKS